MKTLPTFRDTGEVHVSSLVVQARPEALDAVVADIDAMAEAEIHGRDDLGKLIVVLETSDEGGINAAVDAISALAGVLTVNMVFHQVDSGAGEPAPPAARGSERDA